MFLLDFPPRFPASLPPSVPPVRSDILQHQRRWTVEEYLQVLPELGAQYVTDLLPQLLSR